MASYLDTISVELFELIVQDLDVQSVCNLRLTNRTLTRKIAVDSFDSRFRKPRILLQRDELDRFTRAISGDLGRLVEEVTLISVIYDFKDVKAAVEAGRHLEDPADSTMCHRREAAIAEIQRELDQQDDTLIKDRLYAAFARIKASQQTLKRLALRVAVIRDPCQPSLLSNQVSFPARHTMSEAAVKMFPLVISCLQASELHINTLGIFESPRRPLHCGLSCDILHQMDFPSIFSNLRALSITAFNSLVAKATPSDHEDTFTGLPHFLTACPQLESLRVWFHEYLDRFGGWEFGTHRPPMRRHVHELAARVQLSHLRIFSLGGIRGIKEYDLVRFLSNHRKTLQALQLRRVTLFGENENEQQSDIIKQLSLEKFALLKTVNIDKVLENKNSLTYTRGEVSLFDFPDDGPGSTEVQGSY